MVKIRDLVFLITCTLAGLVKTGSDRADSIYQTNIDTNQENSSNLKGYETMADTQIAESSAYDHNVDTFDSVISYQKNQTHPLHAKEH